RARIEDQPERAAAVDHHRRPYASDLVPPRGRDEAWLRGLYYDSGYRYLRLRRTRPRLERLCVAGARVRQQHSARQQGRQQRPPNKDRCAIAPHCAAVPLVTASGTSTLEFSGERDEDLPAQVVVSAETVRRAGVAADVE